MEDYYRHYGHIAAHHTLQLARPRTILHTELTPCCHSK